MIVAAYVEKILPLWTPVNPVSRIERPKPQGRESRHSKQKEKTLASLFVSMTQVSDDTGYPVACYPEYYYAESNGFDFKA